MKWSSAQSMLADISMASGEIKATVVSCLGSRICSLLEQGTLVLPWTYCRYVDKAAGQFGSGKVGDKLCKMHIEKKQKSICSTYLGS